MACRVRCESAPIVAGGTTCIDVSGTGVTGDPLQISETLAPTVTHPLLGDILPNGLICGPSGLEVQPVGQIGFFGAALGLGSIPAITADTAPGPGPAGSIAWGPRLEYQITNFEGSRTSVITETRSYPGFAALLDPGAKIEVFYTLYVAPLNALPAAMVAFYSDVLWRMNNTSPGGPSLQEFTTPRVDAFQAIGLYGPAQPVGDFEWRGIQLWIKATGFGASSVIGSAFFGDGQTVEGLIFPL